MCALTGVKQLPVLRDEACFGCFRPAEKRQILDDRQGGVVDGAQEWETRHGGCERGVTKRTEGRSNTRLGVGRGRGIQADRPQRCQSHDSRNERRGRLVTRLRSAPLSVATLWYRVARSHRTGCRLHELRHAVAAGLRQRDRQFRFCKDMK